MQKKNRMVLLLLLGVFALPVLLAKLALEFDFFNKSSTNKGQLVSAELNFSEVYQLDTVKWQLLYIHQGQCDSLCENALYSLSQVWSALGKRRDRVQSVVLHQPNDSMQDKLAQFPVIYPVEVTPAIIQHNVSKQQEPGIYIVDTLSNAVLYYPVAEDKSVAVMMARDMLSDLKKLLKLSRIG